MFCAVAFSPDGTDGPHGEPGRDGAALGRRHWPAARPTPASIPTRSAPWRSAPMAARSLPGARDRTVRLWDAATGKRLATPLEHPGEIQRWRSAPMAGRSSPAVTTRRCGSGTVEPGQPVGRPLNNGARVFSPDGKAILVRTGSGKVMLWDIASGPPIGRPVMLGSGVLDAAWSPNGRTILTGGLDGTARFWDAATGRPFGPILAHPDRVNAVAFGPDGRTILTGCRDNMARLWDADTGSPIGTPMPHPGRWAPAAFSPDGRTLLTAGVDGRARRWDATTGQPLGPPLPHPGAVRPPWRSAPMARSILTACSDQHRCGLGSGHRPAHRAPPAHPDRVLSVAFSPDGKTILTGCEDRMARLWDAATGRPLGPPLPHSGYVHLRGIQPRRRDDPHRMPG